MLLNLSNHPSETWTEKQKNTAEQKFSAIMDMGFPKIDPSWNTKVIEELALDYMELITENKPEAVHIMGEFTFTFALVALLQKEGIRCIASTTERIVEEKEGGIRETSFRFVQFRDYPLISGHIYEKMKT